MIRSKTSLTTLLLTLCCGMPSAIVAQNVDSLYWDNPFGIPGANGGIVASVVGADSNLYVGGHFTQIGDTLANRVAMWDGEKWSSLGPGLNSAVLALAADVSGNLYAGGFFTTDGDGTPLGTYGRIAKWDGSSWSAMGDGFKHDVQALKFEGSGIGTPGECLYEVGGLFFSFGGEDSLNRWCAGSWSSLGAGVGTRLADLEFNFFGDLYVAGSFTTIGDGSNDTTANNVALFGPGKWQPLGDGVNAAAYALEFRSTPGPDTLWVGGDFNSAGGVPTENVAAWNFASWSSAGIPNSVEIRDLHSGPDGNLWAGGQFPRAGFGPIGNVGRRSGSSWILDEVSTIGVVYSLAMGPDSLLYFGGFFDLVYQPAGTDAVGAKA